jgi:amino acid efflux transporter
MTQTARFQPSSRRQHTVQPQLTASRPAAADAPRPLTTTRGAALYIGALLGPGLLLLPGLAAAQAGPASILAWLALLGLSGLFAAVFSALGRNFPSAGGVMGYVTAGLGARAGRVTGWSFLTGVVAGAPIVCLIGASYVTGLTGGGRAAQAAVAAGLLLVVLGLALAGLRASSGAQLLLVGLLIVVVAVAVAGSAGYARAASWTPFAPHGWLSVGHAATTLMLSFVGWEAVAPLTTRFVDPARQLPRVVGIALAATTALYLSLAVVTVSVLGAGAATSVPLADLLRIAAGRAGSVAAAVAAVVLTLGAINAYVTGAASMAQQLLRPPAATGQRRAAHPAGAAGGQARTRRLVVAIAAVGLLLITLYGLGLVSTASMVTLPTALFLVVYLGSMLAAIRLLRGRARYAAVPAVVAVAAMLAYCGWALALCALVALAAGWRGSPPRPARRAAPAPVARPVRLSAGGCAQPCSVSR